MKTQIYIDLDGNLSGIVDDTFDKLSFLGEKLVERVSNVEYDHDHQCWVATDMENNVIAKGPIRSSVIDAEREHFNKLFERGFSDK